MTGRYGETVTHAASNPPTASWTLDRDARRRTQDGLTEQLAAESTTRVLLVDDRGRVALDAPAIHPDLPSDGLTPPSPQAVTEDALLAATDGAVPTATAPARHGLRLAPLRAGDLDLAGLRTFYLGRLVQAAQTTEGSRAALPQPHDPRPQHPARCGGEETGGSWLGVVVPSQTLTPTDAEGACHPRPDLEAALARYPRSALRAVAADLPREQAELATAAVALAAWHARARYCTRCGQRTTPVQAGWAQRCTGCGDVSFPRTDPAVIMAVTDARDRLVLVHGASWAPGRYSTVAGFVEAGESAEAAVAREVAEETGLRVAGVEPVRTQPWPFPRSLMLAYRARLAAGEPQPRADGEEVTDVLLLTRPELAQAVASGRVVLPGPASVARWLIEDWYRTPSSRA